MSGASTPAPGRLDTVRRFVNTLDIESATDALTTPADLTAWLASASLLAGGSEAGPDDLGRAVAVREALRDALAANHGGDPIPAGALAVLNDAAARSRLTATLTASDGWRPRPAADGVDGALGGLLALVGDAMADGTWSRLKVCVNDTCRWAFYDESRARSGKWCSMQVCGNRAKQQAWRDRRAESTT
ncbi:CGNR zinc finger domain-containing protein [Jiangella mangrovi]|uniref:Putative RNA-binding Zn ribbon-like protein n=1 Tax=Jiangella mangrovi TaxID=1524084 RepID=A0A7W9GQM1_9ACTN|nr:ABATE domain-containing protein [Jiangella mangrovi]MBB5788048.1 putative RNA-binding Zn ribbon-like protein [Jiangella mangrovi]